jgi:hypothetical protein
MDQLGKATILLGLLLVVVGTLLVLGPKIPWLGRLPGDFTFETPRVKLYFPLATSLVLSLVLSLLVYLWRR